MYSTPAADTMKACGGAAGTRDIFFPSLHRCHHSRVPGTCWLFTPSFSPPLLRTPLNFRRDQDGTMGWDGMGARWHTKICKHYSTFEETFRFVTASAFFWELRRLGSCNSWNDSRRNGSMVGWSKSKLAGSIPGRECHPFLCLPMLTVHSTYRLPIKSLPLW